MHLHHVTNDDHQNHQKLLILSTTTTAPYNFRTIDCETPKKDGLSASSRLLPFRYVESSYPIHMWTVTSLHGMVCIQRRRFNKHAEYTDLILWNPLTSDYKTLSKPTTSSKDCVFIYHNGKFGLYYSTSDDDYKLLCVTNHPNPKVYIYSLKSDSWRKVIQTTNVSMTTDSHFQLTREVLLNEKLYFCIHQQIHYGEDLSYSLMMFDTKTEKLREIATPTLREERTKCIGFMVVSGSIHFCVAFTDSQGKYYHTIELWRMNGSDGDWTKLLTYSLVEPLSWWEKPLHIMRNGDWLMYCDQAYLFQRDLNKRTYDTICRFESMEMILGCKYMETLVSPNQYACL